MGRLDIQIKLKRDFVSQYNKLQDEYGSYMARLNGFAGGQLSYTDFIDNFIDRDTVADISVDGNSNVGNKDIVTLEKEMSKPHMKLLAFNKIHYELQKKYGFYNANKWLKAEWTGRLYMHDADTSTKKPYCFRGDTKILTDKGVYPLNQLVGYHIKVLNKKRKWEDATVQYFGKQPIKKLTLVRCGATKEIYVTGNHKWFIRKGNDKSYSDIIETDNLKVGDKIPYTTSKTWAGVEPSPFGVAHGFFTGDGDKGPKLVANFCGDKTALLPYFTPANVTGNEREFNTRGIPNYFRWLPSIDESPSYLYGWLSGYFAADGCVDTKGRCTIASTMYENLECVRQICCVLGMPVNEIRHQDRVSNLTGKMSRVYVLTLTEEYLKDVFFIRPQHIERISKCRARNKDKKEKNWRVVSVEDTGMIDHVYCAVVPGTESFTLDGNVLTHNCFAASLKDLAEKGLYFLPERNALPAKHLITFVDFVKEFISYQSNRSSGACGLPDLLPYMFYFWKKDCDNDYLGITTSGNQKYYAEQSFQRFIYAVNQPHTRDGIQSAFTNTSVFDRRYFEALFGGTEFPDGTFMIDYEEEIIEFQKWYMAIMSKIRSESMFTFPVSSISLLKKKDAKETDSLEEFFEDPEFAKWAINHNIKWSDSNLFIDNTVSSLSNCCFDGSQKVCIKSSLNGKEIIDSFINIYNNYNDKIIYVPYKDEWKEAKVIKTELKPIYIIATDDNKNIAVTHDHINLTDRGEIKTINLKIGDNLIGYSNGDEIIHTIKSIQRCESRYNNSYCFEMLDQDHPYFSLPNGIITHNCRLKSDITQLYFNSIGGTALKVGSVKVGTVNLVRIALESNTEEEYLENLKDIVWVDLMALDVVRNIIKRNVDKGLLPNFNYGIMDFKYLYNTIGFIGIYESMKKFGYIKVDEFNNTFYTDKAYNFGEKIFKTMRETADKFIEKYNCDYIINTEQIPGETAADKLMKKDKFFYGDADIYDLPLYGNQFIPLGIQTTLQERVKAQAAFDSYCNGGSILHANCDAPFDSYEKAEKMVKYISAKGVTYFAFNTKIQVCKNNHAFYGDKCPECGNPVDGEFTRIAGFYTKIKTWSSTRKQEYKLRKWANINDEDFYNEN